MGIPALAGVSGSDKTAADRANAVVTGSFTAVGPSKAFSVWGPFDVSIWAELTASTVFTAGSSTAAVTSTGVSIGDTIYSPGGNVPPGTTVLTVPGGSSVTMAFPPQFWTGTISTLEALIRNVAVPANLLTLNGATIINSPYFAAGVTVVAYDNAARTLTTSAAPTSAPLGSGAVQIWFAPTNNCVIAGTDAATVYMGGATSFTTTAQIERSFDGGNHWIPVTTDYSGTIAKVTNKILTTRLPEPEASVLYRLNCIAYTGATGVAVKYRISTTGSAGTSILVPAGT